jgi:4-amino-4-deoxy-L-arabinose transferase-like glycosyltransferase
MPAFFVTGFVVNPEAWLGPLWVAFLVLLTDLRERSEPWRPLLLGSVVGLAFLAKYTAVLAIPVSLLYLSTSPRTRPWLRRPSLYVGGLVALAIASPVIVWNARHGWASLQLHFFERMRPRAPEGLVAAVCRVVGEQVVMFHPLLWPALVTVGVVCVLRSRRDGRSRTLALTGLPVLAFLLAVMLRTPDSEPHWSMVGYLPLVVAVAGFADEATGLFRRAVHVTVWAAFSTSLVAFVLYAIHLHSAAVVGALGAYNPNADPTNEAFGWDRVSGAITTHTRRLGPGTVVAAGHNVLCGHVAVAIDDTPGVYCLSARRTQFDFIGRRFPPSGAPVVFVESEKYPERAVDALPGYACTESEDVSITRGGLFRGLYRLWECRPPAGAQKGIERGNPDPRAARPHT